MEQNLEDIKSMNMGELRYSIAESARYILSKSNGDLSSESREIYQGFVDYYSIKEE